MGGLAAVAVILGITAALTVSYAGAAKAAKGHHAKCASKVSKGKAKYAKRRAKCKKARKVRRHRSDGAKPFGPTPGTGGSGTGPAPVTTTTGGTTTSTGAPHAAGPGTAIGAGTATGAGTSTTIPTGPGPIISVPPPTTTQPPPPLIAAGASVVSVYATATYPRTISLSRTITERVPFLQLVEVVEKRYREDLPAHSVHGCPAIHEGELKLELLFRASPEGQPVAKVTVPDDCEMLISIAGDEEVERLGPQLLVTQVERVLGVEL